MSGCYVTAGHEPEPLSDAAPGSLQCTCISPGGICVTTTSNRA
jgi:hypothetical protein